MCVYICVCVYVYVCVCVYVNVCVSLSPRVCASLHITSQLLLSLLGLVDMYMCVCVWMCTCVSLSLRVCVSHCALPMGWLRWVGSIKLWVSFAEYRLFYRALLQKRPVILSILLTEYRLFYRALLQKRPVILSILLTEATPYSLVYYSRGGVSEAKRQITRTWERMAHGREKESESKRK